MSEMEEKGYEPDPPKSFPSDGKRVLPDGRIAPQFIWLFRCPNNKCRKFAHADAFMGPPMCDNEIHPGLRPFMDPVVPESSILAEWEEFKLREARNFAWATDKRGARPTRPSHGG
jgi:hypothetical protein